MSKGLGPNEKCILSFFYDEAKDKDDWFIVTKYADEIIAKFYNININEVPMLDKKKKKVVYESITRLQKRFGYRLKKKKVTTPRKGMQPLNRLKVSVYFDKYIRKQFKHVLGR